ncbi:unnamed protein product [Trichogramma brassicae]|uniref:Uncharacterized protein n=1 Tax=Trichogramma brassicae TaxID=86971 RepID=A0A6H5I240_9HYME|nr:unnamed protein product [Trichogramma brassicae]
MSLVLRLSSCCCCYIQGEREREREREGGKESCKEKRRTKEGKGHTAGVPTAQGMREREYTRAMPLSLDARFRGDKWANAPISTLDVRGRTCHPRDIFNPTGYVRVKITKKQIVYQETPVLDENNGKDQNSFAAATAPHTTCTCSSNFSSLLYYHYCCCCCCCTRTSFSHSSLMQYFWDSRRWRRRCSKGFLSPISRASTKARFFLVDPGDLLPCPTCAIATTTCFSANLRAFVYFFFYRASVCVSRSHVYNSRWYLFSGKERRLIQLMILRTAKPCTLTAGPTISMNYKTFATIYIKSYTPSGGRGSNLLFTIALENKRIFCATLSPSYRSASEILCAEREPSYSWLKEDSTMPRWWRGPDPWPP